MPRSRGDEPAGTDATIAASPTGTDATIAADEGAATATSVTGTDATVADEVDEAVVRGGSLAKSLRDSRPTLRHEPLDRGDTLGRYVVLALLGAGGMGEVYAAYDPELDRRIALKVIRPARDVDSTQSAQVKLLDEAKALARLSHPNVVAIHDVGLVDGDVFIAMEFVEGETLAAWLDREDRSWQAIVEVVAAAGRGLEAAHAAGLIHRDVKPDNIMLGKDGRVRMLDFGVALQATPEGVTSQTLVGTPAFMAPEQFTGEPVGPATDQFSLGVTLYVALWGKRPFPGDTVTQLSASVTEARPIAPPPSDVPPAVRSAVMRALERAPADRHPSLAAMLAALAPPARRSWAWAAVAASAAIAAAALVVVVGGRGAKETPCQGFERELTGVWDAGRKQLVAARRPEDGAAIERMVDAYAAEWVAHKTEACRATRVTRAQSIPVLERRMACLDTRRRELDAVVTVIVGDGEDGKRVGVETVTGLASLGQCDNLEAIGGGGPPPGLASDEVHLLEDGLARVRALRLAGAYKAARAAIEPLLARAARVGWTAAAARLLVERGLTESLDGAPAVARETLFEAIRRGADAEDRTSQASAWVGLVGVEAGGLRQSTEAMRWAKHAEVAIAKAGGDHELRGLLLHHQASALRLLERHPEALDLLLEARTLFSHALGPHHYRVALESGAISTVHRNLGHVERAISEGEAALAELTKVLGPRHPALGPMLNNLALAYDEAERLGEAQAMLERAIVLKETELGKEHPSIAASLLNLASIHRRAGRFELADQMWQRAYDIRLAAYGSRHAHVTRTLNTRLIDRVARGLDAEARGLVRDVVARLRGQDDALDLSGALGLQCELERRAGTLDAARRSCAEAVDKLGEAGEANRAIYVLGYAARTATARGAAAEAHTLLARARGMLDQVTRDKRLADAHLAWVAAHLAQAEGHRDEALRQADVARRGFATERATRAYYLADLDRAFPR